MSISNFVSDFNGTLVILVVDGYISGFGELFTFLCVNQCDMAILMPLNACSSSYHCRFGHQERVTQLAIPRELLSEFVARKETSEPTKIT